jgi:sarcosine oxidase
MTQAQVIVVGLGGLGSAAARELAERGVRTLGIEQFGPAHTRGASHGESRGVWQAYFMGPGYVPLLRRAYELWDQLADVCGERFFHQTGGICVGPRDGTLVPAARASAEQTGLTHEYLTGDQIREYAPNFTPGPDDAAVWDPSSGYVRPERVVAAQLELAQRAGADLRYGELVLGVEPRSGGVVVTTTRQTYEAEHVVVSSGAWAPRLLPELRGQVEVVRKVMVWLDPLADIGRFTADRQPYWIWEGADGVIGYGHPAVDGPFGGVKVGIHSGGDPTDPDALDLLVRTEEVEAVRAFLADRVPELSGRYLRSAVCMYDNTPDRGFVIGRSTRSDRVTVAAGTSGHAFKFVPAIGEALAELATSGTSKQDLSLFDPRRLSHDA